MRRADRLFRIVEHLKARRRAVTAETLARTLEVSVRTIYRDMTDLALSGVPIVGAAGVGYTLQRDYVLRPLMFDVEELDALALGAQMVESWGDAALAKAARQAIDKIKTVLPETLHQQTLETTLFSLPSQARPVIRIDFTALRRAIRSRHTLKFHYTRADGRGSRRQVRPLCLAFFGPVWVLLAWCEKRRDFRNFRLDRIRDLQVCAERFEPERGKRLQDYMRVLKRQPPSGDAIDSM